VQVRGFWEFAQNRMHRLAARGWPPGAISECWNFHGWESDWGVRFSEM